MTDMDNPAARHLVHQLRRAEAQLKEAEANGNAAETKRLVRFIRTTRRAIERKSRAPSPAEQARRARKEAEKQEKARKRVKRALQRQRKKAAEAMQAPSVPAKPRKPLAQGKGLPAVNKKRAAATREAMFSVADGYHAYIVKLPCVRCGKPGPGDPAHMVKRSRGKERSGPDTMLPLCRTCHMYQEVNDNQFVEEFEQRHGITPLQMARALRAAYLVDKDGEQ